MPEKVKEIFNPLLWSLALAGSLVSLSYWAESSRMRNVIRVLCGTVLSVSSSPVVAHFASAKLELTLDIAEYVLSATYFWIGLLGMQLVPIILTFLQRFAGSKKDD